MLNKVWIVKSHSSAIFRNDLAMTFSLPVKVDPNKERISETITNLSVLDLNETNKVTSLTNVMDNKKYSSKTKAPYYRDKLREKDRLKRLYGTEGDNRKYANFKKQHSTREKSRNNKSTSCSKLKNTKSVTQTKSVYNRANVLPLPHVIFVPVPLIMQDPFLRFINFPISMLNMMTPVRFQQMPTYSYMHVPVHNLYIKLKKGES
ncbi:hypothetical protein FF38_13242 [Lucilia cuprina]|uniref:Uncharacterized protein n=1 Tax=Lucilia cuprina TaxID=7375 RepID=A0A0L0BWK5_LUCCU|nr:hypothetical protein FF38_13242 [Lucilia cuprina]